MNYKSVRCEAGILSIYCHFCKKKKTIKIGARSVHKGTTRVILLLNHCVVYCIGDYGF